MYQPEPFHQRRPRLVRPVPVDPSGTSGPTRGEARGPRWRTTSHGLVVPSDVERSPAQRIVEAAAVLHPGEAVTGWAALHWLGGTWFDGSAASPELRAVPLVAARHLIAQDGWSVSQEFLGPWEVRMVDGLAITPPVRSVVFEMRYAPRLGQAVEALDMACFSDLVSLAEVAAYLSALGAVTGIQQARDALAEGNENAWSPREVFMRRVWTRQAGLSRPLCNAPVFTLDGRHVGTPDLIDPVAGLVGEYDGSLHLAGEQRARDIRRESDFRDVGLEYVTMVAADGGDLAGFVRRLLSAHARAIARTTPPRWTVEPPDWWTPTATVEQRRILDDWQKARWLRHRRAA
jgi:hypothetical protein